MDILEQFGINGKLLIIQVINFGVLLFILKKVLYKPVIRILEKRRCAAIESMKTLKSMRVQKEELKDAIAKEMDEARERAREVLSRAKAQAVETTKQSRDEAQKQSLEIVQRAKLAIEEEKQSILEDVREDVAQMIVDATNKVVGREIGNNHESFIKKEISALK